MPEVLVGARLGGARRSGRGSAHQNNSDRRQWKLPAAGEIAGATALCSPEEEQARTHPRHAHSCPELYAHALEVVNRMLLHPARTQWCKRRGRRRQCTGVGFGSGARAAGRSDGRVAPCQAACAAAPMPRPSCPIPPWPAPPPLPPTPPRPAPVVKLREDALRAVEQRDPHVRHELGVLLLQVVPQEVAECARKLHACAVGGGQGGTSACSAGTQRPSLGCK